MAKSRPSKAVGYFVLKLLRLHKRIGKIQLPLRQTRAANDARAVKGELRISRQLVCFRWIRAVGICKGLTVAERGAIETKYVSARLLILQLVEVGVRNVDALVANAGDIDTALRDLAGPEIPTARVGVAAEKVVVVLLHKKVRIIERVGRWRERVVIDDRQGGDAGTDKHSATSRIAERETEHFIAFDVKVVDYQHDKALAAITGSKGECARADGVIGALLSRDVTGLIIDRNRARGVAGARDG